MAEKADNISSETGHEKSDHVEVIVTLDGAESRIQWNRQIPLLDALLNAGIHVPYSCCRGNCGTCVCKLEQGEVRIKRNFVLSETHLQQGLILTCVAAPISANIKINYDQF